MSEGKVLFVTERSARHQEYAFSSAPAGLQVSLLRQPKEKVLLREIAEADFFVSERVGEVDAELIAAAPRLRLIQRIGSLSHDIDLGAAQRAGVMVSIWPDVNCIAVAEHMVMQMLALAKRLPDVSHITQEAEEWGRASRRTDENVFAFNWSGRTNIKSLFGQTIGILGFGEIGVELARRLRAFVPRGVLYHKRRPLPAFVEAELGITYATRQEIIAASDLLCVLLPYMTETDLSINETTFAAMKRGAFVVHCGSGSVIDEDALATALGSGQLAGAALDTFEWEPLRADNPLVAMARNPDANVLLTPHTAGIIPPDSPSYWTNIQRVLAGDEPLNRLV